MGEMKISLKVLLKRAHNTASTCLIAIRRGCSHSIYISTNSILIKANEMHNFSNVFDKVLYMFRTGLLSNIRSILTLYTRNRYLSCQFCWLSVSRQPTELAWQIYTACIQCWDTPDDGQWTCPNHV